MTSSPNPDLDLTISRVIKAPRSAIWTAWTDPKNLPVRACIEAKLADPACLVEIMVVAAK